MSATTYYEQMCEGCQGSGQNSSCDGDNLDESCQCEWHTDEPTCPECDGFGYYDPDPADELTDPTT